MSTGDSLESLTVEQLKTKLRRAWPLKIRKKAELVERLRVSDEANGIELSTSFWSGKSWPI